MSDSEQLEKDGGYSVADLSLTKSLSEGVHKSKKGSTLRRADAAWLVQYVLQYSLYVCTYMCMCYA